MSSPELEIVLKAIDNASKPFDDVGKKLDALDKKMDVVTQSQSNMDKASKKVSASAKDLVYDFSALGTSGMMLYQKIDNINDAQLRLDKANLAVSKSSEALEKAQKAYDNALKSVGGSTDAVQKAQLALDKANLSVTISTDNVSDAQMKYNAAVEKFGADSPQAQAALSNLQVAQEKHDIAVKNAEMSQGKFNETLASTDPEGKVQQALTDLKQAQENYQIKTDTASQASENFNKQLLNAAITGVPAIITAVGSAVKLMNDLKNIEFSALLVKLGGITTALDGVTASAIAAHAAIAGPVVVGIAVSAVGMKLTQQELEKQYKAAGLPVEMMPPELKKLYTPAGQMAPLGSIWKQEGGIFSRPTIIGVGEKGPEAVVPLERGGGFGDTNIKITGPLVVVQGSVDKRILKIVEDRLESVIIKASSSRALATHKKIRRGSVFSGV